MTALGSGRAVRPMPASWCRPGPTGGPARYLAAASRHSRPVTGLAQCTVSKYLKSPDSRSSPLLSSVSVGWCSCAAATHATWAPPGTAWQAKAAKTGMACEWKSAEASSDTTRAARKGAEAEKRMPIFQPRSTQSDPRTWEPFFLRFEPNSELPPKLSDY